MKNSRAFYLSVIIVFFSLVFSNLYAQDDILTTNLYYDSGEFLLSKDHKMSLDELTVKLDRATFYVFEINSFTDSIGSVIANKNLSQKRAKQVESYLLSKGITASAISLKASGESRFESKPSGVLSQNRKTVVKLRQQNPFKEFEPARTSIEIDPSRLNIISGVKGTSVIIPANSLVKQNGAPVYGKVTFTLAEFYSQQDFVYGQLHTTSENRLIESGGSLNLRASQNGNELKIKAGRQLKIKMPAEEVQSDMLYFSGTEHDESQELLDWQVSDDENSVSASSVQVDFKRAEKSLKQLVDGVVLNEEESNYLEFFGEPGNEVELGILLGNAIRKMDERQIQLLVDKYELDMLIAGKEEDIEYFRASFSKGGRNFSGSGIVYRQSTKRVIDLKEETFEKYSFPETDGVRFIKDESEHIIVLTKERLDFESIKQVRNYIVTTGNLGWINCDRFLNSGMMLADIEIKIESELLTKLRPCLVFKKINSVMRGQVIDNETVVFRNVPLGMDVSLFGFTAFDNQIYSVAKNMKTSATTTKAAVEPTTKEELVEAIASLTY